MAYQLASLVVEYKYQQPPLDPKYGFHQFQDPHLLMQQVQSL